MEISLNRESCVRLVDEQGWDVYLKALDDYTGNRLGLYTVSTDWHTHGTFICKAKGERGDLLVTWS